MLRAIALEILGPDWQPPITNDDPYAAALDAAQIRATPQDLFASAKKPVQALVILDDLLHAPQATRYEQDAAGRTIIRGRLAVLLDQADVMIPLAQKAQMPDERLRVLATLLSWGHDPILARTFRPCTRRALHAAKRTGFRDHAPSRATGAGVHIAIAGWNQYQPQ